MRLMIHKIPWAKFSIPPLDFFLKKKLLPKMKSLFFRLAVRKVRK